MSVRQLSWFAVLAASLAHGAGTDDQMPMSIVSRLVDRTAEAALREDLRYVKKVCDLSNTTPYLTRVYAGPVMGTVEDALTIEYQCLAKDDARLREAGRDATKQSAGQSLIEYASDVATRGPFGWDMTYATVFDAAKVPSNDTMRKMFRDSWLQPPYVQAPALLREMISSLETATAAVLVDLEVRISIYGGRRAVALSADSQGGVIRGSDHRGRIRTHPGDPERVREFARAMLVYAPQAPNAPPHPLPIAGAVGDAFIDSGYLGVVSVAVDGQSRQFLITEHDIESGTDERANGPLMQALLEATNGEL